MRRLDPNDRSRLYYKELCTLSDYIDLVKSEGNTNNFMAQTLGRKRVKIIPACEVKNIYNHKHCYTHVDGHAIDARRFPAMNEVRVMECVLEPGELLFLPVGCWHYVESLDVSVTMSFTNFIVNNDHYSDYESYGPL